MDSNESQKPSKYSLKWFLTADDSRVVVAREFLLSVCIVAIIGIILFSVSGIWPPMVAVESGSMEPNMQQGDLVFAVEEERYAAEFAVEGTGIVTHSVGEQEGYTTFGDAGDVLIYKPNGNSQTPVIHRAMFWVNDSEDWTDEANPAYLPTTDCSELKNCPAPHSGFITKGDANDHYDQATTISEPVRPEWIRGKAELRIPYIGYIRLIFRV